MKKLIPCTVVFILSMSASAYAQSFLDYFGRIQLIPGFEVMTLHRVVDTARTDKEDYLYIGMGIGWNIPVVELKDNLAIGLDASVRVHGLQSVEGRDHKFDAERSENEAPGLYNVFDPSQPPLTTGGEKEYFLTVPILATLRYGTDATFTSDNRFGIGIGLGYSYIYQSPIDYHYWHPTGLLEASVRLPGGVARLQLVRDFGYNEMNPAIEMKHWGGYISMRFIVPKKK